MEMSAKRNADRHKIRVRLTSIRRRRHWTSHVSHNPGIAIGRTLASALSPARPPQPRSQRRRQPRRQSTCQGVASPLETCKKHRSLSRSHPSSRPVRRSSRSLATTPFSQGLLFLTHCSYLMDCSVLLSPGSHHSSCSGNEPAKRYRHHRYLKAEHPCFSTTRTKCATE